MLSEIERWITLYPNSVSFFEMIGTWFAAIGTVAAVITSLHLARRSELVRMKTSISYMVTVRGSQHGSVVGLSINNRGPRPIYLSPNFFEWKAPFWKNYLGLANHVNLMLMKSGLLGNDNCLLIESGKTQIIPLGSHDAFSKCMQDDLLILHQNMFCLKKFRLKMLSAQITTNDDYKFKVHIYSPIRKIINSALYDLPKG